jgi:hypothetical protein
MFVLLTINLINTFIFENGILLLLINNLTINELSGLFF